MTNASASACRGGALAPISPLLFRSLEAPSLRREEEEEREPPSFFACRTFLQAAPPTFSSFPPDSFSSIFRLPFSSSYGKLGRPERWEERGDFFWGGPPIHIAKELLSLLGEGPGFSSSKVVEFAHRKTLKSRPFAPFRLIYFAHISLSGNGAERNCRLSFFALRGISNIGFWSSSTSSVSPLSPRP